MASIVLPTCPIPNEVTPFLRTFGGILVPFLGGPDQAINRIGTRMGLRVIMPSLDNDEARPLYTRLMRGKQVGAILNYPLFDFDPGSPPSPHITAASTGTALRLGGLGAGYKLRDGQPLSVSRGGRWYLHFITGDVTADESGTVVASVFPPTRVAYGFADQVAIVAPKIEGNISPGDENSWQIALDNSIEIAFSIVESR
jgi:hypothetical protein